MQLRRFNSTRPLQGMSKKKDHMKNGQLKPGYNANVAAFRSLSSIMIRDCPG